VSNKTEPREPVMIPFSLSGLVEEVLGRAAEEAGNRGVELGSEIDPAMPERLIGDPAGLQQVVGNLIENAIRFTEKGGIQLKIERASIPSSDTCEVEFSVSDTGVGIPEEMLRGIFKDGQVGSGLVTAKAQVEAMGGVIWAESRPGQGSRFHFRMVIRQELRHQSS